MVHIQRANWLEAEYVAKNLRPEDEAEVIAATGQSPMVVVPTAFRESRECYTVRSERDGCIGGPVALFGISDDKTRINCGVIWMLCTPGIHEVALDVARSAENWLDYFSTFYPGGLHNVVDARNTLHLRWLSLAGFTLGAQFEHKDHLFIYVNRNPNVRSSGHSPGRLRG